TPARPDRRLLASRLLGANEGSVSLNRLSVYLEARDVHVTAGAVAAARHQVGKTDFVDLTEINRLAQPGGCILGRAVCPLCHDAFDVEFHPALGREHELGFEESGRVRIAMLADIIVAVRELDDGMDDMEAGGACDPAHFRHAG